MPLGFHSPLLYPHEELLRKSKMVLYSFREGNSTRPSIAGITTEVASHELGHGCGGALLCAVSEYIKSKSCNSSTGFRLTVCFYSEITQSTRKPLWHSQNAGDDVGGCPKNVTEKATVKLLEMLAAEL